MARRLESLQKVIFTAVRCFGTLHTGERAYYTFRRGVVKDFKVDGNGRLAPHVYVIPEGREALIGSEGWYPVSALWFEMPNGETVK